MRTWIPHLVDLKGYGLYILAVDARYGMVDFYDSFLTFFAHLININSPEAGNYHISISMH